MASPAYKYRLQCYLILLQFYISKQLQLRLGSILSPSPTEAMMFCDHPKPRNLPKCCFLLFKRSALYNTNLCTAWLLVPAGGCERLLIVLSLPAHEASCKQGRAALKYLQDMVVTEWRCWDPPEYHSIGVLCFQLLFWQEVIFMDWKLEDLPGEPGTETWPWCGHAVALAVGSFFLSEHTRELSVYLFCCFHWKSIHTMKSDLWETGTKGRVYRT